jgi:hypothetical protein
MSEFEQSPNPVSILFGQQAGELLSEYEGQLITPELISSVSSMIMKTEFELINSAGAATILNVSRQRITQLNEGDKMPTAVTIKGATKSHSAWLVNDVQEFFREREITKVPFGQNRLPGID